MCVADQIRRNVDLDVILADDPVWGEVFAFEVRVDRHVVLGASSTNRGDEVDGGYAAPFFDERCGVLGQ